MLNVALATLVHEAERLDNRSLDAFIDNILSLRAQRATSDTQKKEAALLKKINKGLSPIENERFSTLNTQRIRHTLSATEQNELLALLEKLEKLNVSRLKYLTSLARLRNISVRELMQQLGLLKSLYA
jgi:Rad3-related DNA helicase